jgi:hypothetical protein
VIKSGLIYWCRLERDRTRRLLNLYRHGVDKISVSRLGRKPEDITQREIERLEQKIVELNSLINRGAG